MALTFKTYSAIERKPSIFGIALQDILILTALFVALLLFGAMLMVFGIFFPIYFALVLLAYLSALFLLFKMKPKGQPDYFLSFFSFHFMQPRKIEARQISIHRKYQINEPG